MAIVTGDTELYSNTAMDKRNYRTAGVQVVLTPAGWACEVQFLATVDLASTSLLTIVNRPELIDLWGILDVPMKT